MNTDQQQIGTKYCQQELYEGKLKFEYSHYFISTKNNNYTQWID